VVITSGGLGPTVDDKTREAVASATGRQLFLDRELLKEVADFFKKRGLELGENREAFLFNILKQQGGKCEWIKRWE